MKGDITRSTFQPQKHYSSVRMQQGRVQLDADWNEQRDLEAHRDHTTCYDIIGPCGVAKADNGFNIQWTPGHTDLAISPGRMYVDGFLCELEATPVLITAFPGSNEIVVDSVVVDGRHLEVGAWVTLSADGVPPLLRKITQIDVEQKIVQLQPPVQGMSNAMRPELRRLTTYLTQPDLPTPDPGQLTDGTYLVYLDVWQRHITALEDPEIREVALGGPDSATRTQTVWQVKVLPVPSGTHCSSDLSGWQESIASSTGRLSARAEPELASDDPCIVAPGAGYRGLENQLYRVEIHQGGVLDGVLDDATWKWSRDNGSVVALWTGQSGANGENVEVQLASKDEMLGWHSGAWVELFDDTNVLHGKPGTLVRLAKVEGNVLTIDLATTTDTDSVNRADFSQHPKVRRWDTPTGEKPVMVSEDNDGYVALEDGVEIKFAPGSYQTGDYWLIPARTVTGGVAWPTDASGTPLLQSPQGIQHHYCKLAIVTVTHVDDCRKLFPSLTEQLGLFYVSGDGQHGEAGKWLPHSLQVGVANGQWPVAGARVRFRIATDDGNGRLSANADSPTGYRVLIQETGADGVAVCYWQLDTTTPRQLVEAHLVQEDGTPIHLPVRFSASMEPGIHITDVLITDAQGNSRRLENDSEVPMNVLTRGLAIVCDENIRSDTVESKDSYNDQSQPVAVKANPKCFVTLDMPFLDGTWRGVGFWPLILAAEVTATKNVIKWEPIRVLGDRLTQLWQQDQQARILAHLTLKGNFIWVEGERDVHLDGTVFGEPRPGGDTALRLPSGDGRRGGDFEMWFWLIRPGQ